MATANDKNGFSEKTASSSDKADTQMTTMIQQEVAKYINSIDPNLLNMVSMMDSSGIAQYFALNAFTSQCTNSWIMDSGASNHICGNIALFDFVYNLERDVKVILPNGSTLLVIKAGRVTVSPKLILLDVFFIPEFKFNLISIHKLTKMKHVKCIFLDLVCILQEPQSELVIATGELRGSLYILNQSKKIEDDHSTKLSSTVLAVNSTLSSAK